MPPPTAPAQSRRHLRHRHARPAPGGGTHGCGQWVWRAAGSGGHAATAANHRHLHRLAADYPKASIGSGSFHGACVRDVRTSVPVAVLVIFRRRHWPVTASSTRSPCLAACCRPSSTSSRGLPVSFRRSVFHITLRALVECRSVGAASAICCKCRHVIHDPDAVTVCASTRSFSRGCHHHLSTEIRCLA